MSSFLAVGAAAAAAAVSPSTVGGLEGCWNAPGHVRGKDAMSVARGEWHLGRRYFTLHLRSVPPVSPYEAAITYGAGQKKGQVGSIWMDTFGGLYEPSLGLGAADGNSLSIDYRFPDAVYHNRFERLDKGWRWTIVEQSPGKPDKLFAEYQLTPASCHGMTFKY